MSKRNAILAAATRLFSQNGFKGTAMAELSAITGAATGTIFHHFKNKEDLLVSTYIEIKMDLSRAMLDRFDDSLPIRDILRNTWFSMFDYINNNSNYYQFMEQFAN